MEYNTAWDGYRIWRRGFAVRKDESSPLEGDLVASWNLCFIFDLGISTKPSEHCPP